MYSMSVKLISVQKPVGELVIDGIESVQALVAFCARVSNPGNQYNVETSERLLEYLKKHKHWSPFEMVNVCMEIEAPRDILRQVLRHKSFSFQEFSQRYSDVTEDLYFTIREARLQDNSNRQNSIDMDPEVNVQQALNIAEWEQRQRDVIRMSELHYKWAIENGIAKECARVVLPEGNTLSRLYMNGSLRSWIHYLDVRLDPSTQKEHREVAREVARAINKVFPIGGEV